MVLLIMEKLPSAITDTAHEGLHSSIGADPGVGEQTDDAPRAGEGNDASEQRLGHDTISENSAPGEEQDFPEGRKNKSDESNDAAGEMSGAPEHSNDKSDVKNDSEAPPGNASEERHDSSEYREDDEKKDTPEKMGDPSEQDDDKSVDVKNENVESGGGNTDSATDSQKMISFQYSGAYDAQNDYDPGLSPHVDVVHVFTLQSSDERVWLNDLGLDSNQALMERREYNCFLPVQTLLKEKTQREFLCDMRSAAVELLAHLKSMREQSSTEGRRAIIFVAYDLGSILVKNALAIASGNRDYEDIFHATAATVFCGCPQRSPNPTWLEKELFRVIYARNPEEWNSLPTVFSVRNLAEAVYASTSAFINSKFSIRARILSLYPGKEKFKKFLINLNAYSATLGLPTESQVLAADENRYPYVGGFLVYNAKAWIPHPSWIPWERYLLAISAAPRPSPHIPSKAEDVAFLLEHPIYTAWVEGSGARILYIHGATPESESHSNAIADQILWQWHLHLAPGPENPTRMISFTFDRTDPLRDSMADFSTYAISQLALGRDTSTLETDYKRLQFQYEFHGGWSDKAMLANFDFLATHADTVFLLRNFDECDEKSRGLFLKYLHTAAEGSEEHIRVMVTSRRPNSLFRDDDPICFRVCVDGIGPGAGISTEDSGTSSGGLNHDIMVSNSRTAGVFQSKMNETVLRLRKSNVKQLDSILLLVQEHTGWPIPHLSWSVSEIFTLLDRLSPERGVTLVVCRILNRYRSQDGFTLILNWLMTAARPLTVRELTGLLCTHYAQSTGLDVTLGFDGSILETAQHQIEAWLRGLIEIDREKIAFRSDVRDALWDFFTDKALEETHNEIVDFCLGRFQLAAVLRKAEALSKDYQTEIDAEKENRQIVPPLVSDGVDIIFYCIEFLPFHLARCNPKYASAVIHSFLGDSDSMTSPSTTWARLYWAMTNPFLRPPGILNASSAWSTFAGLGLLPLEERLPGSEKQLSLALSVAAFGNQGPRNASSAWSTFAGLGLLPLEERLPGSEKQLSLALSVAAFGNQGPRVVEFIEMYTFSIETLIEALVGAVSSADEETATVLIDRIHQSTGNFATGPVFPSSLTWATAWLDLAPVARKLLQSGSTPDPGWELPDGLSIPTPSPLYMAAALRNLSTAKALLDHGASLDIERFDKAHTPVTFIVLHPQLWDDFCERDSSCLAVDNPRGPFYGGISWGSWWSIPKLLDRLGGDEIDLNAIRANSDYDTGMSPLVSACMSSYPRTVQALLKAGANPNHSGPWSPLWVATVWSPNEQIVKNLLDHGADPNRETGDEVPLLYGLVLSALTDHRVRVMGDVLLRNDPPIDVNAKEPSGGMTALMAACGRGRLDLVIWLLDNNADPNILDNDQESALHNAVRNGHAHVVKELISKYPDLVTTEKAEQTLLISARSSPEIVRLLLDANADTNRINNKQQTLVNVAAVEGFPVALEILLERDVNIHNRDMWKATAICDAIDYRHVRVLRLLIDHGANLKDTEEEGGNGLLHLGVNSSPEILRILLEHTKILDLNQRNKVGMTPLIAVRPGTDAIECIKLLINAGADINLVDDRGESALHFAIGWETPTFRDLLLSQPEIDINVPSKTFGSPLDLACWKGRLESVTALLDLGADIHQTNITSMTCSPLVAALLQERSEAELELEHDEDTSSQEQIVRKLINHGADVRQTLRSVFWSPLAAACYGCDSSFINLLLDEGAQPEAPDPVSGRIPLHYAAASGIDNFQVIIHTTRGDPTVADHYGKTALHWAAQFGHVRTVEYILSLLSNPGQRTQALEHADRDGWTALSWAARSIKEDAFNIGLNGSRHLEPRNYLETIRVLLEHGADQIVRARWGDETLTPLEMAQRCDAEQAIIDLLKPTQDDPRSSDGSSSDHSPKFTSGTAICDICLGPLFGHKYQCSACPGYMICTKCNPISADFHPRENTVDSREHIISVDPVIKEFQDSDEQLPEIQVDLTASVDAIVAQAPEDRESLYLASDDLPDDGLNEATLDNDDGLLYYRDS